MARPTIGTPEEVLARRRAKTAERVRRLRERRRAESAHQPEAELADTAPSLDPAAHYLRIFVERIERAEKEMSHLAKNSDKRHMKVEVEEIYTEAENLGYDKTVLKEHIRLRRNLTTEQRILLVHYQEASESDL
jgi:uncharacterized protein (UPF0335 family)